MDQQNLNYGRDQNIFNQTKNFIISDIPDFSLQEIQGIAPFRRLINYITALFFLLGVLCWWSLLGFFTKCEFPLKRIFNLLLGSFFGEKKGLERLSEDVKNLYKEKVNSHPQDLLNNDTTLQRYSYVNQEKSELYVLRTLIEILFGGSSDGREEVDKAIEIIQKKEASLSVQLDPLRKKYDPDLERFQRTWTKYAEVTSDLEIDYRKTNEILNSLVYKFAWTSKPSPENAEELLEELRKIILDNPHNINISRLDTLHNALQLLKWMAATDYSKTFNYEFKTEVDSARNQKAMNLIVEQITEVFRGIFKDIPPKTLDSINLGISEKWLAEFSIYGLNNRGLAVVELALEIDWNKFNRWRDQSISDGMVRITWGRKVAVEIDKIIDRFKKFLQRHNLDAEWRVGCAPGFTEEEIDEIFKKLEMQSSPVYWNEQGIEAQEEEAKIRDLSELGVGIYFKPRKGKNYS